MSVVVSRMLFPRSAHTDSFCVGMVLRFRKASMHSVAFYRRVNAQQIF